MGAPDFLSTLNDDERKLVVSIPYRVGIWVSHADDEGGERDDRNETKALGKVFSSLTRAKNLPFFIAAVLDEIQSAQDRWVEWEAISSDTLSDCARVLALLESKASASDAANYKKLLKKIAFRVAGAHGEFGEADAPEGFFARLSAGFKKLKPSARVEDFMNISPAEEEALRNLARTLDADADK
jgi:hypothetical protein